MAYIDEVIFKAHATRGKAWSRRYCNLDLPKEGTKLRMVYVVVAVSKERGIERFQLSQSPIVKKNMVDLIGKLARKEPRKDVTIFWDNLRMHYSKEVKDKLH
jgi:hypothetical protein